MLFLIDSNIAIASDPLGHDLEAGAEAALRFLRLATTHHHDIRTHPASENDFARIADLRGVLLGLHSSSGTSRLLRHR